MKTLVFSIYKLKGSGMAQGIILAAGLSSRAQTNKMLLMFNGKTMIQETIDGMKPFVSHIFVVTGHYNQEIMDLLNEQQNLTCVENKSYMHGMFSSVLVGARLTSEDFFIMPGDCPFVSPKTYEKLLDGKKDIRIPSYQGQKGHPIFISRNLKEQLLREPIDSNLRDFRNRFEYSVIDTDDPHILIDIDTPSDYLEIKRKFGKE